jgi:hypothetical protein
MRFVSAGTKRLRAMSRQTACHQRLPADCTAHSGAEGPGKPRGSRFWARLILRPIISATCAAIALSAPTALAQTADMCTVIARNPDWIPILQTVEQTYGVTPGAVLAVIDQESRFNASARGQGASGANPQRNFGYSQANLRTWNWFLRESGYEGSHSRTDFAASAHFIGWHFVEHVGSINAPVSDTYRHYLVYKQGLGGYRRGASAASQRLARTVARRAATADSQLDGCGL